MTVQELLAEMDEIDASMHIKITTENARKLLNRLVYKRADELLKERFAEEIDKRAEKLVDRLIFELNTIPIEEEGEPIR